jgi:hypothetical protein
MLIKLNFKALTLINLFLLVNYFLIQTMANNDMEGTDENKPFTNLGVINNRIILVLFFNYLII